MREIDVEIADGAGAPGASDRLARRNTFVLSAAQAVGGIVGPLNLSISALAGSYLLGPDKSLATLPVTAFVLGTAAGTMPAAMLMRRLGRRPGFMGGMMVGAAGALVKAAAMFAGSFWLLCLGAFMMGLAHAFVQQFRFAAADTASPIFRPKAISWVLAGGIVAAVLGPQTVIFTKDLLAPIPFAGAYLSGAVLMIVAALILTGLRIPRVPMPAKGEGGRTLMEIARQPVFVIAVVCAISSYALMNLVMTAAPLAMVRHGHSEEMAVLAIQWHVLAMFGPSFITGPLIVRYGAEAIIAAGLTLLIGCAVVALAGLSVAHFWGALILLGVGWNFGFIGATTMVTRTYAPVEKERVQGFNDLLVFGWVAIGSFSSGKLLVLGGWSLVNLTLIPISLLCLAALGWIVVSGRANPGVTARQ
ncbi:MAG: MFS transporter [Hyphomicrobiales bacterium]